MRKFKKLTGNGITIKQQEQKYYVSYHENPKFRNIKVINPK
jgi:hypothetical protein